MAPQNRMKSPGSNTRRSRTWLPCAELRPYVASFELRDDSLGSKQILNPLPARSDCFLQFQLKQPYIVVSKATAAVHASPARVLVGPHTQRTQDIIWTGDLEVFTIRFSPVGFRSLFGIPAEDLRNQAIGSELVLGSAMITLEARLAEAEEHRMPAIAEKYLLSCLAGQQARAGAALTLCMTAAIRSSRSAWTLQQIAAQHDLSLRQMQRLFQEYLGISPKVYQSLHRTNRAMALRRAHPEWDWASIAAVCGYFDQAHLIRDFKNQNGTTPALFARSGEAAEQFRLSERNVAFVQSPVPDLPLE